MEQLGDVAYHIFLRLPQKDLLSLTSASVQLRVAYQKVEQNPHFWYERASALTDKHLLIRPGITEWKLIYTLILQGIGDIGLISDVTSEPIRRANTLRVLFEDLRIPFEERSRTVGLGHNIRSAEVLEYLLDTSNADYGLVRAAITSTALTNVGEAKKMLVVISQNKNSTTEMKKSAINAAVFVDLTDNLLDLFDRRLVEQSAPLMSGVLPDKKNTLSYLLKLHHPSSKSEILRMIDTAVRNSKLTSLSVLLDEARLTRAELSELYASREGRVTAPVLRVLLDRGLVLTAGQWRALLTSSIRSDTDSLVRIALEYINPMTATNQSLLLAVQTGSDKVLRLLLSDPRIDPTVNLKAVLQSAVYAAHKLLILRDPRVDIDTLSRDVLEISNKAAKTDRLFYPPKYPQQEFFSPTSSYWYIARFLLLKQPTAEETLQYIRDNWLNEEEVREAVLSIFNWDMDYSYEAASIRALLLFLIYPKMTVAESEGYLRRDDEYPDELVDSSNFLINLVKRE